MPYVISEFIKEDGFLEQAKTFNHKALNDLIMQQTPSYELFQAVLKHLNDGARVSEMSSSDYLESLRILQDVYDYGATNATEHFIYARGINKFYNDNKELILEFARQTISGLGYTDETEFLSKLSCMQGVDIVRDYEQNNGNMVKQAYVWLALEEAARSLEFIEEYNLIEANVINVDELDKLRYGEDEELEFGEDYKNEGKWRKAFEEALNKSGTSNLAFLFKSVQTGEAFIIAGDLIDEVSFAPICDLKDITYHFKSVEGVGVVKNGNFYIVGKPNSSNFKHAEMFEIKALTDDAFTDLYKDLQLNQQFVLAMDLVLPVDKDRAKKLFKDRELTVSLKVKDIKDIAENTENDTKSKTRKQK